MCLNRSVPIWNRQKYKEDNNGPATSQSVGQPVRVCCDCGRDIRGIFPFRLFCPLSYQRHLPRVRETFVLNYSTQKERMEMMWRMITFIFRNVTKLFALDRFLLKLVANDRPFRHMTPKVWFAVSSLTGKTALLRSRDCFCRYFEIVPNSNEACFRNTFARSLSEICIHPERLIALKLDAVGVLWF